jgi:hypothetical protein
MTSPEVIPIVAAGASVAISIFCEWEIGWSLRDHHPEEWSRLSKSLFLRGAINKFALSGRHRQLGDPDLTFQVMCFRAGLVGFCLSLAWVVFAATVGSSPPAG